MPVLFLRHSQNQGNILVSLDIYTLATRYTGLAVGLSVGKEYSKTLSIIKTAFEEIHLLFFYYHCKQKH